MQNLGLKLLFIISLLNCSTYTMSQPKIEWNVNVTYKTNNTYIVSFIGKLDKNYKVAALDEENIGTNIKELNLVNVKSTEKAFDNYSFENRVPNGPFANYYTDSFTISIPYKIKPNSKNCSALIELSYLIFANGDKDFEPPVSKKYFILLWKDEIPTIYVGYPNLTRIKVE